MKTKTEKSKRVVAISDLHCGHRAGLTPPTWSYQEGNQERDKYREFQTGVWNWLNSEIKQLQPVDVLIVNGDAIDGLGEKSGGELLETDPVVQCDIAIECIEAFKAKRVIMTYGTPYHVGVKADHERIIANHFGADISGHHFIDVNGVVFDVKHAIGSSVIPHGRHTAINRDALWNIIWNRDERQPLADIILRSHVHYHVYSGGPGILCIITPALQGYGSKFGVRRCSGTVDIGFISFDIQDKDNWSWHQHLLNADFLRVEALNV